MSFDINNHTWTDRDVTLDEATEAILYINVNYLHECSNEIQQALGCLNKQDAIAIAKHFGLTAEDLNQPPQSKE